MPQRWFQTGLVVVFLTFAGIKSLAAQTVSAALSGVVSSQAEGVMEGVIVGAKRKGATVTVSVVSDKTGRYVFPADRLEPGDYSLRVRATGYMLEGGGTVTIGPGKNGQADLRLRKTSAHELASQLSDSEWLMSMPGIRAQKDSIRGCNHCHTYERIMRSKFSPEQAFATIERMARYTPSSFPHLIQPNPPGRIGGGEVTDAARERLRNTRQRMADFISSINLSRAETWQYELKTLPRPSGKATRVIYTEYDVPAITRQPHDVTIDSKGFAWYASFGEQILGRLDPRTGQIKEWPIPVVKPSRNKGVLDVQLDADDNVWVANGFQGAVQMFDARTEKFRTYPLSPELDGDHAELLFVAPGNSKVDGKVWVMNNGEWAVLRLDIAKGTWEKFSAFPVPRPRHYTVLSDSSNNAWFTVIERSHIGRIDAKTGKIDIFKTDEDDSGPRRGMVDKQDAVWAALNRTDRITRFDPKSRKFQSFATGIPEYYAYDVWIDRAGDAWASTEYADRVARINPKTGEVTAYLLPGPTNMRRSHGDNATRVPSFWVGANHTASIIRVEPLE
jgi:virginiamycin B lyase